MSTEEIEKRWSRWDDMINKKKYADLVLEFDQMIENREKMTFGDLVRRDDALELMGIISLSPNAVHKRKWQSEEFKKAKNKNKNRDKKK